MREAEDLNKEISHGLSSIDKAMENIIDKRYELMNRAERALSNGKITQSQYDEILKKIRNLPKR
jgi:hypothetical protein